MTSYMFTVSTILFITTDCFMIPPQNILESTILSSSSVSTTPYSSSIIWEKPKFTDGFESYWYYWQSTSNDPNNENINYGTVKWLFNTTHMYYYFNIPSLNIEYHQYIVNQTYYLWTQNDTKINCFKYTFPFHIIHDYFHNSSFAGLTNDPDIQPPTHANIPALFMMQNTTNTTAPTMSPSNAPTHSPTHAPTHSPTNSPTVPPTRPPSRSPTNSPTQSPTQSTQSPTNSPTKSPNMYPMSGAEAIWIGYLWTERIFGRNMTYIVTANSSGYIGHLYITLNSDNINLENKITKSDILWLKNISWNYNNPITQNIPSQCLNNPINTPTAAPSVSPTVSPTGQPSMSPTVSSNMASNGICSLPQPMIILYVVLITFFILLLFCWYARKNNMMSRIIAGDDTSLGQSSDRYQNNNYSKYKGNYNGKNIKKINNKSESRSKYNKKMYRNNNDLNKHNKPFIGRKASDRYVGDDDSDCEYHNNNNNNQRQGSKISSIDIGIPTGQKKNRINDNNQENHIDDKSDEEYQQ